MNHTCTVRVFYVEGDEELAVDHSAFTSKRQATDWAGRFVAMMNDEHRAGCEHVREFHDGEVRTYRAEVYQGEELVGNVGAVRLN